MEEISKCLICGEENFVHLFQCKDYFLSYEVFSISQCKSCGFRFTNPRPDNKELEKYYNSVNYISHSEKPETLLENIYHIVRKQSLNKKFNLINKFKNGKTILDIGCGTGEFINIFKLRNWEVNGIEPNKIAREIALKKYGLEIFDESHLNNFQDREFDVISMWHVLEHVYNTDLQINQIKRILKDDGIVVIAVPNSASLDAQLYKQYWAAYDVPRHLYHFTKKAVIELLSKYNFEVNNILPMKFDAYYISMLSEKYMKGKNNYLRAFLNGMKSNIYAKKENNYSSLIFICQKSKILV